jgi:hypothetical protein
MAGHHGSAQMQAGNFQQSRTNEMNIQIPKPFNIKTKMPGKAETKMCYRPYVCIVGDIAS